MKTIYLLSILFFTASAFSDDKKTLTLHEARAMALRNHPRISAAELKTLAARQRVIQSRSAFFPSIVANATAVSMTDDNTRIAAGGLNNPSVFERNAEGITVSQLITDFGRTANLTESSKLRARAEESNTLATRAQVLFQVDAAYFKVLQMDAIRKVAAETVASRQVLFNQVSVLASNKLKSDLDVSFSRVTLEEGKLLLNKAENELLAASTTLLILMGETNQTQYQLAEEDLPPANQESIAELIQEAFSERPELVSSRLERDAAQRFAKAERALHYPTVSAVGGAGFIPMHDSHFRDDYAAAGVNLSLPIFSGNLFSARQREAELLAKRAAELLRDQENSIVRDVRLAFQNLAYSHQRLELSESFLESATKAYELAQARYNLGASSIVELSQAQLNKTSAEIGFQSARYDFQIQNAALNYQTGKSEEVKTPYSQNKTNNILNRK